MLKEVYDESLLSRHAAYGDVVEMIGAAFCVFYKHDRAAPFTSSP